MSDQPKELQTIIALHKALLDETRMFHVLKYTENCDCESCARNRAQVSAKYELTKIASLKALEELKEFITETDMAIQMIKLVGETKQMLNIKHDIETTTE